MQRRIDIRDAGFLRDPAPALAAARSEGPLAETRIPLLGKVFVTTTDAATRALLKDPRFVRSPQAAGLGEPSRYYWWLPRFMAPLMRNIIMADGAEHRRLRGLVDVAFSKHSMEALKPELTRIANGLLDGLPSDAPVDIVESYCRPLPLLAICVLLGIPEAERQRTARMTAKLSEVNGAVGFLRAMPGIARLMRHFRGLIAETRVAPRPGLLADLVAAQADGDRLDDEELLAMVVTLFLAGHETTVHLAAGAIIALTDHPEARAALAANPSGIPLAVEEAHRFMSPVMMTKMLFPTEEMVFEGTPLKPGDRVVALLIAANHDPARVDGPETFDITRRPNAHLGYGHGPHVCLGMQLARTEMAVMLERLLARHPDWRLAVPRDRITFAPRLGLRGLKRLPLILG